MEIIYMYSCTWILEVLILMFSAQWGRGGKKVQWRSCWMSVLFRKMASICLVVNVDQQHLKMTVTSISRDNPGVLCLGAVHEGGSWLMGQSWLHLTYWSLSGIGRGSRAPSFPPMALGCNLCTDRLSYTASGLASLPVLARIYPCSCGDVIFKYGISTFPKAHCSADPVISIIRPAFVNKLIEGY